MASGKTHDFIAFASTVLGAYGLYCFDVTGDLEFIGTFAIASLFGGLMFGPDLDTKSVQYQRWRFLKFIWLPYQAFGHRSKKTQSHDALFGPLVRIVYFFAAIFCLAIFVAGIFSIFDYKLSLNFLFISLDFLINIPGEYQLSFISGLWFGNIIHYFTDWLCEFVPKKRRMIR